MEDQPQDVARIVELGEAGAYADFYASAPTDFAARHGIRVERIGSAISLVLPDLDAVLFNRVIGLGLIEPATATMVGDIAEMYQQARVSQWAVQLSPAARPSELPAWLTRRGLSCDDHWAKVYRGAEPPPNLSIDLRIECIGPQDATAFAAITCDVFGVPEWFGPWLGASIERPGWRHYLAFDGDQPVATGALYVRQQVGWLGMAATLPSHRGRGAQGALMAQRIRDGLAMGCRWLITETGEDTPEHPNPSFHNMLRTGFKLAYRRANYMPAGV